MWDNNQPLARKSNRRRRLDRDALTEDKPLTEAMASIPAEPADPSARQASRIFQSLLPVQVLRKRGAIKVRRGMAKLAKRRPKLEHRSIKHWMAARDLRHANHQLNRFDDLHGDISPGRFGRALRSPYRQMAIGGLGVLDVVAYMQAVEVMFNLHDDAMGRIEMVLLSMISIGMVVLSALAAHYLRRYHEDLEALDALDDAEGRTRSVGEGDEDDEVEEFEARNPNRTMASAFGVAALLALVAGAIMRVQGSYPLLSVEALAMGIFSAIPMTAAAGIEYLGTSTLRHERDGLVNEQKKAARGMKASVRTEAKYRKRWELVSLRWATIRPTVNVQILDALVDVTQVRGDATTGMNAADGRLPSLDGLLTDEWVELGISLTHLDPATVMAEAKAKADAGFPVEAETEPTVSETSGAETDSDATWMSGWADDQGTPMFIDLTDEVVAPTESGDRGVAA